MTETYGYDKTPTPPRDYDVSKVPPEIKKRATWVKTKFTGEDVAEAYGQAMEITGIYSDEAKQIAQQTKTRQDNLETQFDAVQQESTDKDVVSSMEIVAARGGKATLGQRLDETTAQLAQKAEQEALEVEKSRIDTLIALPDGSTTNDARLEDIAVGVNGEVYDSPGNAVRNQVNAVNTQLAETATRIDNIKIVSEASNLFVDENSNEGFIVSATNGNLSASANYFTTDYIEVEPAVTYRQLLFSNRAFYDVNKVFISGGNASNLIYTSPSNAKYIRLSGFKTSRTVCMLVKGDVITFEKEKEALNSAIKVDIASLDYSGIKIPAKSLGVVDVIVGLNIFNNYRDKTIDGLTISATGEITALPTAFISDYISVEPGLYKSANAGNRSFYDSSKHFISGESFSAGSTITVPANAVYMIITNTIASKDNVVIVKGSTLPTSGLDDTFILKDNVLATNVLSPLFGKKISCLGDSFTAAENKWHSYIASRTGCVINNYGVGGSAITPADSQSALSFLERYNDITLDSDAVVIFGGINDSWFLQYNLFTLGNPTDTTDDTFCGALNLLCEGLINKFPTKPIVALLPPNLLPYGDYHQHIDEVCEAEKVIYAKYGIPYFDLRAGSTISTMNSHASLYNVSTTNIHWNSAGYERASYPIQKFLESYIKAQ